jgi:hypothetical protein
LESTPHGAPGTTLTTPIWLSARRRRLTGCGRRRRRRRDEQVHLARQSAAARRRPDQRLAGDECRRRPRAHHDRLQIVAAQAEGAALEHARDVRVWFFTRLRRRDRALGLA